MKQWSSPLRPPHSIRARLIVLVLAIFLPFFLVGLWVVNLTHQLTRDSNQRLLVDTARALSMVLDRELAQRAGLVRALALSRMLDAAPDIPPGTLQAFDDQARRTLTGLGGWLEVRTPSRVLVNTRLLPGDLPRSLAPVPTVDLVETSQIQPLIENEQLGIYHAALVQPVLRNGRAVLNLTLTLLPHEFQRIINQQQIQQGWVAAIIDSEGRVVARHPGGATHAGRYANEQLRHRISTDREGLMHTRSLDGRDVTIYFSTTEQGWTYITGMPQADFEGMAPENARNLALGTLVLLTLAVLAALGVSQGIVRPIQFIKRLADDMKNGQAVQAEATGIVECDEVAQALARASESIHGAQREMERRVDEAIAQTRQAHERMSNSQRLEALGRLTGGVAHDFNNLLGVISNSGHLMLRRTQDPQITASIEVSLRAVAAGSRLTQHLLRFAGRQSVRPSHVLLSSFLDEAAELIRAVMGQRIQLGVVVEPATLTVFVDPSELELALFNLALNARDAIADRGRVELRARPAAAGDCAGLPLRDCVVVSVSDDGAGIDQDSLHRVFEPFFSTKGLRQATGLGLSQVHGFCQQSGGTVRLESAVGVGTTVNMVLPAQPVNAPTQAAASAARWPITGLRVLLVEDNAELREVTSALLVSLGCEVVSSTSAQDALRLLHPAADVDIVLTDVLMPGPMNGMSLARQVRKLYPGLPIVTISGHRGEDEGSDEFPLVQKPYTPQTLVSALQAALSTAPPPGRDAV